MPGMTPRQVGLYAVVPAGEEDGVCAGTRGLHSVVCGPVAAIIGKPGNESARAALRHDRVVGRAVEVCSSVVPFRLGVELQSETVHEVLHANMQVLFDHLARFHGRVEMGLKAKLAARAADEPLRLPFGLERVRALTPRSEDRREGLRRASAGQIFEGCYLISRQAVLAYWSAVEEIRCALPELPLLGSGPWAAYSFCDFALRPVQMESRATLQAQGGET